MSKGIDLEMFKLPSKCYSSHLVEAEFESHCDYWYPTLDICQGLYMKMHQ